MEFHLTATECHLTYGITQCYLPPDASERTPLKETIKPNISNKSKNILSVDRVEEFMQRRNVEVSLSYHIIVVTLEEHMSYC